MPNKKLRILAIETSCDETSAAVIEGDVNGGLPQIKTNIIASQIDIHKLTNGVVPEVAARAHAEQIVPVIEQALSGKISEKIKDIDALAVTYGPGLIGSLLVGIEGAKTLAFANDKPLIPVNHLEGHIYAALMAAKIKSQKSNLKIIIENSFPSLALIVSGGHTELVLVKGHGDYEIVGQTMDDAAGEAFDKVARLMGLSYPGGPEISKLADSHETTAYGLRTTAIRLPRPMIKEDNLNFSFSGLKTAVMHFVQKNPDYEKAELAYEFEQAVVDVLVAKTKKAYGIYQPKSILLTGGVAANKKLRQTFEKEFDELLKVAPVELCGDNAGMIGLAAYYKYKSDQDFSWSDVNADPSVGLSD